jgi:serine/threonine protein phosphatase PrpC
MRFLPGNAQHIGARHSQQDSFGFGDPDDQAFIAHGGFLAVVCDGMGGMEYGDLASKTAVRTFLDAYRSKAPEESIPGALARSVIEANRQVVALATDMGMVEGIGTTLVATALHEDSLYFISVGDSGIFRFSGGQIAMINHPHVFANMLDAAVARGTMSREDAEGHPERESLTSYIGTEKLEEIDQNAEPIPVEPGDTILLASDGLFKTLQIAEMRACFPGNPQSWPDTLVERTLAKKRDYQDNVTVLSVTADGADRPVIPRTVVLAPSAPEHVTGSQAVPKTVKLAPQPVPAAVPIPAAPVPVAATIPVAPPAPLAVHAPEPVTPPAVAWTPTVDAPSPMQTNARFPWLFFVVILVIGAGIGAWLYVKHKSQPQQDAPLVRPSKGPQILTPDPTAPDVHPPTPTEAPHFDPKGLEQKGPNDKAPTDKGPDEKGAGASGPAAKTPDIPVKGPVK